MLPEYRRAIHGAYMSNNALYRAKKVGVFGKLMALLLVFILIMAPLRGLLAEEGNGGQEQGQDQNQGQGDGSSGDQEQPPTDDPQTPPPSGEPEIDPGAEDAANPTTEVPPQPNDSKFSNKRIVLAQTDESSGALSYFYPLTFAPGRNGLTPDLNLTYNSQGAAHGSVVGDGWSLSIPTIERTNKTGFQQLYSGNFFTSSLSGELVNTDSSEWRARVDNGDFAKYAFDGTQWTMTNKNGMVYTFGSSPMGRQDDPVDPNRIYKWFLQEIRDTNGNFIRYEYFKDQGQVYPDTIRYTGHGSDTGLFSITFSRSLNTAAATQYYAGFPVTSRYRIMSASGFVDGALAHRYDLTYVNGDNGGRALLHSITETGWSNATATALPPTTFDYGQRSGNGWGASSSEWQSPVDLRVGVMIMDLNGDALPDLIQSSLRLQQWTKSVYLNNGHGGWTQTTDFEAPVVFNFEWPTSPEDNGVREADLNGDGRADLIQSFSTIGHTERKVYLNTGSGWEDATETWGSQQIVFADNSGQDTEARIADLNGDGLPDLFQISQRYGDHVYINNGHGWDDESSLWTIPVRFYGGGTIIGDVNGDKLPDLLESRTLGGTQEIIRTYINTGNRGWALSEDYAPPTWFGGYNGEYGVRGVDVNGDELMDLIQRRENPDVVYNAWINNGHGWTENNAWIPPLPISYINSGSDTATRLVDIDGDGMVDMFRAFVQAGHTTPTTWLYKNAQSATDAVTDITLPEGGQTAVTYRSSATYATPVGERLNPKLSMTLSLVSRLTQTDNFGYALSKDYEYALGKYYFNTNLDRRFSGFGRVTVTDGNGNRTITSYHGGTQDEPAFGQYQDHIAKAGKPYRSETRSAAGALLARTISAWDRYDAGSGRNIVKLIRQVEQSFAPNGMHSDSAETYVYDNATGNKTGVQSWGEVTGSDDGTFTDSGSDAYATTMTYAANAAAGIYGLPAMTLTIDQNNEKVSESRSYYDNLSLGQVSVGNQTKQEQWIAHSVYATSLKTYNAYGLPLTQTDPRGKVTLYVYDTPALYPASVTNPASQTTSYLYDYNSGQVRQLTDPNGSVFVTAYDGLGRPKQEWQPDRSNPASPVLKAEYEYTDTSNAKRVRQLSYLDAGNAVERYTYLDGFGRPIQERSEAAASGSFNVRDIAYTDGDLPLKESLPYASSGSARTAPTTTSILYTEYAYDALKRPVEAQNAVGTTTTAYEGWKTIVSDAAAKVKDLYHDAYGNLVQVGEHDARAVYTTTYEWNGLKKLIKLTDAAGNIRNFAYDGLGRVTTSEDLHAPADTTFGIWSYAYDPAGNLSEKTDPSGKTLTYEYDDLNRVLSEDSSTEGGIEAEYGYDSCANGIGRLCSSSNAAVTSEYEYDALGAIASEERTIDSVTYTTAHTADRQGNPLTISNPDASLVRYAYNSAGLTETVERREDGGAEFMPVVSAIYNPLGLPLTLDYGNGSTMTNTYDAEELYRLRQRVTVANGITLQDLAYTYDPVGNITRIVDASDTQVAKTTDYQYDDLHRLLSATITNAADETLDGPLGENSLQTFAYDPIGNIIYKSDVGSYLYEGDQNDGYANPHAVTSINGEAYTYDMNGNMSESPDGKRYHWDYNNRLTSVDTAEGTPQYLYDPNGQRVVTITPSATTHFPSATYSTDGTTPDKHIFLGDTLIATVRDSGINAEAHFLHTDHLTGSNVATDESAALEELTDYYAFGTMRLDEQTGDFKEVRKYTGHEYDVDTSLTYANARYYDAKIGKFLGQDNVFLEIANPEQVEEMAKMPYDQYLSNPQVLNSYSYVANNPLKYRDQTGDFLFLAVPIITSAPVWVPAVITAGAAIGAGVASWNLGASIGHLMEGNTQASSQSLDKVESALLGTATVAGGTIAVNQLLDSAASKNTPIGNSNRNQPYSGIPDTQVTAPGRSFSASQKAKIYQANMQKNGGVLRSDLSGQKLQVPQKSMKGVVPSSREAQIDHIIPKNPKSQSIFPGTNSYKNAQVLSRRENRLKSNY